MKILFSLCGDDAKASSRVRGYWVAEQLRELGQDCRLRVTSSRASLLSFVLEIPFIDVVIFQKSYTRYHKLAMAFAKLLGKKVFLDIDDEPSRIQSPITIRNFRKMASMAHCVLAGSQSLYEYVGATNARVELLPTGIKANQYQKGVQNRKGGEICIGWIGNGKHYENDLVTVLVPPLSELCQKFKIKLKIVGSLKSALIESAFHQIKGLKLELVDSVDWSSAESVVEAMNDFDIGVYPLLDNEFNRYKCGFKALEYMAMAIPVVASPNGANRDVVDHNTTGFLAKNESEWESSLTRFLESKDLREEFGDKGRRRAIEFFDIGVIAGRLLKILERY